MFSGGIEKQHWAVMVKWVKWKTGIELNQDLLISVKHSLCRYSTGLQMALDIPFPETNTILLRTKNMVKK